MDYIEAFKNLSTNNKYSRKSPHKAVLLLAIIDMCETNTLSKNVIYYDDTLRSAFQKTWEQVLKEETLFHPEMYLPYWFMQSEDFWHIVPRKGKEDIVTIMRDEHIKPSESKLIDCVKYAELDEDLFFLMTIPSGRTSLREALLETYFDLSREEINRLSESQDNTNDKSAAALSYYEKILMQGKSLNKSQIIETDKEIINHFKQLDEDLQIVLNIDYYSFLKKHRIEREMFKEVCPTVYDLYDRIAYHPLKKEDLLPAFAIVYLNFLSDLKISLLSEDNSIELIDKIMEAINILYGFNGETETNKEKNESEDLDVVTPEKTILINADKVKDYGQTDEHSPVVKDSTRIKTAKYDFTIENTIVRCSILNKYGDRVFSDVGKFKYISGNLYRLKLVEECFTIKEMVFDGSIWIKGDKKIVAYPRSDLFRLIYNTDDYCNIIEDIVDSPVFKDCKLKVNGNWYFYNGNIISDAPIIKNEIVDTHKEEDSNRQIEVLKDITKSPLYYDRRQALIRAMGFFRVPATIKDICRTISRTAWGTPIREFDVEEMLNTMPEVENRDGKYFLISRRH